jgi:hypothetical protein
VITGADIVERVAEWQLTEEVIEKDYVLGWLLWGIGADPTLGNSWVFKGGTCLKKCYIETYRFSEDLDFTVLPEGRFDRKTSGRFSIRCSPASTTLPASISQRDRRCFGFGQASKPPRVASTTQVREQRRNRRA